jgi:nucleoid-associated protein YgaU
MKFVKTSGDLIGGKKASEASAIETHLKNTFGDKIKDLQVFYAEGKVTLVGKCDSSATQEKAILLVGNLKGVGEVYHGDFTAPKATGETEYYTIQKGDTLWKIAQQFLGNGNKYPEIFEANKEVIKDANLIYPGQQIRIPKAGVPKAK